MRGLQNISCFDDLELFVMLWSRIQMVQLTNQPDTVVWKLTANKMYSARSAYEAQFIGRLELLELDKVWTLKAEEKVRFFIWLLLQDRLWIADRLQRRGWEHDDRCCLCDQTLETAQHLALDCVFSKQVWQEFASAEQRVAHIAATSVGLQDWWAQTNQGRRADASEQATVSSYVLWNLWNERNRHIFQKVEMRPRALTVMINQDVARYRLAHRPS